LSGGLLRVSVDQEGSVSALGKASCCIDSQSSFSAGDTVNTGPIYAQLPDSDLDDFAASTAQLAALSADLRLVCVSHFGRAVVLPPMLREVADAFAALRSGSPPPERSRDAMNRPVRVARLPRFSILVADPDPQ